MYLLDVHHLEIVGKGPHVNKYDDHELSLSNLAFITAW